MASAADFPQIPQCSYTVKEVPQALEASLSPAFYLTVPLDRPQDNSIYINPGSTSSSRNLYTTMAHEGWPGHMYQTQYFNQTGACNLRKLLSFSSYTEGWATYVEYYAYRLDNGLAPGPVSYTHLDVYKRQIRYSFKAFSHAASSTSPAVIPFSWEITSTTKGKFREELRFPRLGTGAR